MSHETATVLPNLSAVMENKRTFRREFLGLARPSQKVTLGKVAIGIALALGALEQIGVVRCRLEGVSLFLLGAPIFLPGDSVSIGPSSCRPGVGPSCPLATSTGVPPSHAPTLTVSPLPLDSVLSE